MEKTPISELLKALASEFPAKARPNITFDPEKGLLEVAFIVDGMWRGFYLEMESELQKGVTLIEDMRDILKEISVVA